MKRLIFCAALALAMPGCTTMAALPATPAAAANQTVLDEKGAIGVELAYTAAAKASSLAIRSGVVTDRETIARIGQLNERAYAAVKAVRAAYDAGNATGYLAAFTDAKLAIAQITAAF